MERGWEAATMAIVSDAISTGRIDIHSDNFGDDAFLRAGLKLNHLRMIVAIEDSGQISAAAETLNISQPAASRMLAEMESILKTPLYERVARGVVLTTSEKHSPGVHEKFCWNCARPAVRLPN
jgi:hypothetical protein